MLVDVDCSIVKTAIGSDQVVPFFQPIVDLRSGCLVGFEVLARWQHPSAGAILPEKFISLAEDNGLIDQLTEQILRKSFASAPLLPAPLMLNVNVTPHQLHDLRLPRQIRDAAETAGFSLERLTIEVTESALCDDLVGVRAVARNLKEMGCRLALDDFGTGYSSLRHLQSFPFDELKIDLSFVRNMTDTRKGRKIVATIIELGHSLDLITVGEGVETEAQAEMLLRLGCQLGQGWLYGKPMAEEKIPGRVAAEPHTESLCLPGPGDGIAASSLEAMPTQRLAQLQAIYDGAPVGLCFLDCHLQYVSINRRLAEMNGFQAQAHIGRTVMEMFPDWSQNYLPYLRRALQGEAITGVEIQRPSTKPGQTMTTLASYQPARDEAGEVIGVSVSVTDITEHKRAAKTLVEREEDQRYVFELNSQVQWIMDAGGKMLQVSSQWEQMTGLSKERTCNLGWLKALHTEDVEPTMNALHEALFTGQPFDMEFRIRSVAGTWMWMRSRGTPCHGPLGEITRWYGSIEDISEHRQTEYTLRKRVARSLGFPGAAPVSNQMENVLMWNADGKMRNSVHVSV